MPFKTITKFLRFVILLSFVCIFNSACSISENDSQPNNDVSAYSLPEKLGHLKSEQILESSGLASSACHKDVLWTHNDSGNNAELFAIRPSGDLSGIYNFKNLINRDWESLSSLKGTDGKCYLYIADIGNNNKQPRSSIIYRLLEPAKIISDQTYISEAGESIQTLHFDYSDGYHNAEAIIVHPHSGDIYIITKEISQPAGIYKIAGPKFNTHKVIAERIGEIKLPSIPYGAVTGGDISPDGKRVVLVDYLGGYELILPNSESEFDRIWSQSPLKFDAGDRKQGESAAYSIDGSAIYTTSEGKNTPIYKIDLRSK